MNQNILIVDDHAIVRAGIEILLTDKLESPFFYEADWFEKCLDILSNFKIDLVILDINLPEGLKTTMISKIRSINPVQKILIFSAYEEEEIKLNYIRAGVNGFVSKLDEEGKFIEVATEIPRWRSISIKSEVAPFFILLLLTAPASWMAPPNKSSFSVKVVFPASGWEMIPNVLRLAISCIKLMNVNFWQK